MLQTYCLRREALQCTRGACLREMRTERMRETSLACLLDLGLKSHSRATRSHSVPGDDSSMSFTKASSAALEATAEADLAQTPRVSSLVATLLANNGLCMPNLKASWFSKD